MKTLPPAGSTSPTLATRYSIGPSFGATRALSAMLTRRVRHRASAASSACSRLADPFGRRVLRGDSGISQLGLLVEQFDRGEALRHERAGAVEFLLGELHLGLLLHEIGLGLVERPPRLAHQGCVLFQRRLEIPRVHHRDYLARLSPSRPHRQRASKCGRQTWCRCRSRRPRAGHFPKRCRAAGRSRVNPPITGRGPGDQQREGHQGASEPAPRDAAIRRRRHHSRQFDDRRRPDNLGAGREAFGTDIGGLV